MECENKAEYTLAVVKGIIHLKLSETRTKEADIDADHIRQVILNREKKYPQVVHNVHEYFYAGKSIELATRMLYRAYNLYLKTKEYANANNISTTGSR